MTERDDLRAKVAKYIRQGEGSVELRELIEEAQRLHVNLVALVQDITSDEQQRRQFDRLDEEEIEDEEVQWQIAERQLDRERGK